MNLEPETWNPGAVSGGTERRMLTGTQKTEIYLVNPNGKVKIKLEGPGIKTPDPSNLFRAAAPPNMGKKYFLLISACLTQQFGRIGFSVAILQKYPYRFFKLFIFGGGTPAKIKSCFH